MKIHKVVVVVVQSMLSLEYKHVVVRVQICRRQGTRILLGHLLSAQKRVAPFFFLLPTRRGARTENRFFFPRGRFGCFQRAIITRSPPFCFPQLDEKRAERTVFLCAADWEIFRAIIVRWPQTTIDYNTAKTHATQAAQNMHGRGCQQSGYVPQQLLGGSGLMLYHTLV